MSQMYVVSRKSKVEDRRQHPTGMDFGGTMHFLRFKANRDIVICGINFFEPHSKLQNGRGIFNYKITVVMKEYVADTEKQKSVVDRLVSCCGLFAKQEEEEVDEDANAAYLPRTTWDIMVRSGETIKVMMEEGGVKVPSGTWIEIKFKIEGPPTEYLFVEDKCRTILFEPNSKTWFQTMIGGSGQLKDFIFTVENK